MFDMLFGSSASWLYHVICWFVDTEVPADMLHQRQHFHIRILASCLSGNAVCCLSTDSHPSVIKLHQAQTFQLPSFAITMTMDLQLGQKGILSQNLIHFGVCKLCLLKYSHLDLIWMLQCDHILGPDHNMVSEQFLFSHCVMPWEGKSILYYSGWQLVYAQLTCC